MSDLETVEEPDNTITLTEDDFPLLVAVVDKDDRIGTTILVRGPGEVDVPEMPESGRPWSIRIAKAREDYAI